METIVLWLAFLLGCRAVWTVVLMVHERNEDRRAFGDAKLVKQFRAENVLIPRRSATPPENA